MHRVLHPYYQIVRVFHSIPRHRVSQSIIIKKRRQSVLLNSLDWVLLRTVSHEVASKNRESEGLKVMLEMPSLGGSAISNCVAGSCIGYSVWRDKNTKEGMGATLTIRSCVFLFI